ncbi:MAG: hypothetical protein ACREIC_20590 [Limisphaerales bacterium]
MSLTEITGFENSTWSRGGVMDWWIFGLIDESIEQSGFGVQFTTGRRFGEECQLEPNPSSRGGKSG